ncbi:hypothetical protein EVAR_14133_1 [Eumeta japonica]|uniref:Uncharacterized protein n=1 Tax=Eumeta variegata TaxID=151549 RepID=A0A4C1UF88_EUMVA|nr:hypothetical protein EVAR_14133_1 [Eumeta japonica]
MLIHLEENGQETRDSLLEYKEEELNEYYKNDNNVQTMSEIGIVIQSNTPIGSEHYKISICSQRSGRETYRGNFSSEMPAREVQRSNNTRRTVRSRCGLHKARRRRRTAGRALEGFSSEKKRVRIRLLEAAVPHTKDNANSEMSNEETAPTACDRSDSTSQTDDARFTDGDQSTDQSLNSLISDEKKSGDCVEVECAGFKNQILSLSCSENEKVEKKKSYWVIIEVDADANARSAVRRFDVAIFLRLYESVAISCNLLCERLEHVGPLGRAGNIRADPTVSPDRVTRPCHSSVSL